MNKEIIYSMNTAYRGEYEIQGFSYGSGDKAACIVGAMRGNEFQQLYISSLLAKKLGELEARGASIREEDTSDTINQLQLVQCGQEILDNRQFRYKQIIPRQS